MSGKDRFLASLYRKNSIGRQCFGTATSIACHDLMARTGSGFPEAHRDAEKMASLAIAGHTILGLDVVMPLFSVCHEAEAMGCRVDWGNENRMPESGKPIFGTQADINIPQDLLIQPGCSVPLRAIELLKKRLGDDAAVCGKVFGSWTQSYHYFGIENFLIMTIDNPDMTRRILDKLLPVAIRFARAQVEAGADCILVADHATRDLCSPAAYHEFLAPLHSRLAEEIDVPLLLHICGDTSDRIGMIAQTGIDCFHWDTKTGPSKSVRHLAGEGLSLMGGISNLELLNGSPQKIRDMAENAAKSGIDIVGPECAIPLATPIENLKAIVAC